MRLLDLSLNELLFIINGLFISINLTRANGNPVLTQEEVELIFGSEVPEFNVFKPTILAADSGRRKRDVTPGNIFEFNALGRMYRFEMEPVQDLISPDFVFLGRDGATPRLLNWIDHNHCAFRGVDLNQNETSIALVMCGNVRGVVKLPQGELVIEPLPESVVKHRRVRRSNQLLGDHIVYRRRDITPCPWKSGTESTENSRSYLFERFSQSLLTYNPSTNTVPFPSTSEFPSKDATNEDFFEVNSPQTFYVETAVFVDRDLLRLMETNFPSNAEEQVIEVVLAMVNAVQLLYSDPSLGHKIKYVLKRLELLYQDPPELNRPHDIDTFLTKFCNWQNAQNPPLDSDPLHWDHALILTGLDLYTIMEDGTLNSQVVGLAPVAGMCTPTSSCTVNEGRHFESVYVVTHEIGHNLGMRHDGLQSGNNCDPSGYLMSPTLGSGKVTWSHCSSRYLNNFLRMSQSKCLRDKPIPPPPIDHEGPLLPGQRFSADQQCMLKNGIGSRASFQQPSHEVCGDLHCIKDGYTWTSHPALEGTQCGQRKLCRRGECVETSRGLQSDRHYSLATTSSPSPHERGRWGSWSECKSPCLYGLDGILSSGSTGLSLSRRQCSSCRNDYRYKVCSGVRQCSLKKKKTLQDYADEVCRLRSGYAMKVSTRGLQRCEVECLRTDNGPGATRAFFPDGTVCRSPTNNPTYCVAGFCTEFVCEETGLYRASSAFCSSAAHPSETPFHVDQFPSKSGERTPFPPVDRTPPNSPGKRTPPLPPLDDRNTFLEDQDSPRTPLSGMWGKWLPASECRFSCLAPSKGIQLVTRSCLYHGVCTGLSKNIQLCTPAEMDCDKIRSPFEYASTVCQRYSDTVNQLSGIGMQLSSIPDDPDRGCIVACQDAFRKYRFYRVNGKDGWFPFGTECSNRGFTAFCLNGKCLEFNSDGTPLRDKKEGPEEEKDLPFSKGSPENIAANRQRRFRDDLSDSRWRVRRNLRTSSHRLPGSFQDSFLLSLIDEINATFWTSDGRGNENSFIDLENPLFQAPRLPGEGPRHPTMTPHRDWTSSYKWKIVHAPCSVTCGPGRMKQISVCVREDNEQEVDSKNCLYSSPYNRDVECSRIPCSDHPSALSSGLGKWVKKVSEDINNTFF